MFPFRKHPLVHSLSLPLLCLLLKRASGFSFTLTLPQVSWVFRKSHLSLFLWVPFSREVSLRALLSCPLFSAQAPLPPFPTLPPRSQNGTGRQPRLKQGSGVRVVSGCTPNPTPPVLAPAWWPWGLWLGWVPGFGGAGQGWSQLSPDSFHVVFGTLKHFVIFSFLSFSYFSHSQGF